MVGRTSWCFLPASPNLVFLSLSSLSRPLRFLSSPSISVSPSNFSSLVPFFVLRVHICAIVQRPPLPPLESPERPANIKHFTSNFSRDLTLPLPTVNTDTKVNCITVPFRKGRRIGRYLYSHADDPGARESDPPFFISEFHAFAHPPVPTNNILNTPLKAIKNFLQTTTTATGDDDVTTM